jgi:hypothetical protein
MTFADTEFAADLRGLLAAQFAQRKGAGLQRRQFLAEPFNHGEEFAFAARPLRVVGGKARGPHGRVTLRVQFAIRTVRTAISPLPVASFVPVGPTRAGWHLPSDQAQLVHQLVPQDTDHPGHGLCRTGEVAGCLQGREKGFGHGVFGQGLVAQS